MKQIEKAHQLLPWYITGKLSPPDVKLVEDAMTLDSALKEDYELQQKLSRMIKKDPQLMEISVISTQEQRMDALMHRIRTEKPVVAPPLVEEPLSFFTQQLNRFKRLFVDVSGFPFSSKRLVFAAVASIVLIQVVLFSFLNQESSHSSSLSNSDSDLPNEYKLMAEPSLKSIAIDDVNSVIVIFSPTATEQEKQQVLREIDEYVIESKGEGDSYELVFSQQLAKEQIEELILKMDNNKLIQFVGRS